MHYTVYCTLFLFFSRSICIFNFALYLEFTVSPQSSIPRNLRINSTVHVVSIRTQSSHLCCDCPTRGPVRLRGCTLSTHIYPYLRVSYPSGSTLSGCASVLRTCVLKSSASSSEKRSRKYLSVSASQNVSILSSFADDGLFTSLRPT